MPSPQPTLHNLFLSLSHEEPSQRASPTALLAASTSAIQTGAKPPALLHLARRLKLRSWWRRRRRHRRLPRMARKKAAVSGGGKEKGKDEEKEIGSGLDYYRRWQANLEERQRRRARPGNASSGARASSRPGRVVKIQRKGPRGIRRRWGLRHGVAGPSGWITGLP
ncbi:hypothetical protein VTK56DRAFT_6787 [Thermocarpiscus australiensis]